MELQVTIPTDNNNDKVAEMLLAKTTSPNSTHSSTNTSSSCTISGGGISRSGNPSKGGTIGGSADGSNHSNSNSKSQGIKASVKAALRGGLNSPRDGPPPTPTTAMSPDGNSNSNNRQKTTKNNKKNSHRNHKNILHHQQNSLEHDLHYEDDKNHFLNRSVAGQSKASSTVGSSFVTRTVNSLKNSFGENDKCEEDEVEEAREEEYSHSVSSETAYEMNLRRKHNQASRLLKKRKFDSAVGLFEEIVVLHKEQYGEWHPRIASALHNVAIAKLQAGDLEGSIEAVEDALEKRRMSLGEESPKVVETLLQMGIILNACEEYDDALEVLAEALELKEDLVRLQHPSVGSNKRPMSLDVAKILNNIGCVHYESCDNNTTVETSALEEAELAFSEALDIQEELLEDQEFIGPQFLCMSSTMCNLAFIYMDRGCNNLRDVDSASAIAESATFVQSKRYLKRAINKLEDAITIQQGLLDDGHNLILNSLDNISFCYFRLQDYDNATKYYKRLLKAQKLALGSDHVDVSDTLIKIAKVYLKLCQFEKSYKILDAVTKFYDKYLGKEDRRAIRTRALANSVEYHLTPASTSGFFSVRACMDTSYEPKQHWVYNSSNIGYKDALIIQLRRQNITNPFTSKRVNIGELSSQFDIVQWDIKKPVNVSKMSGQRISFA